MTDQVEALDWLTVALESSGAKHPDELIAAIDNLIQARIAEALRARDVDKHVPYTGN